MLQLYVLLLCVCQDCVCAPQPYIRRRPSSRRFQVDFDLEAEAAVADAQGAHFCIAEDDQRVLPHIIGMYKQFEDQQLKILLIRR